VSPKYCGLLHYVHDCIDDTVQLFGDVLTVGRRWRCARQVWPRTPSARHWCVLAAA